MIEILKVQEIVREAAKIFSNRNAAEQIKQKGVFDYVTAIDEAVQEFIQKELSDLYPQIQFMGEEKVYYLTSDDFEQVLAILRLHLYSVYRFLFSCHNKRPPYDKIFYHRRPSKTLFTEKVSHSPYRKSRPCHRSLPGIEGRARKEAGT